MRALAFVLAMFWGSAMAQDAQYLEGMGRARCGEFVAAFDQGVKTGNMTAALGHLQWAYGYLSAMNESNHGMFRSAHGLFGTPEDRASNMTGFWIYDACKLNPDRELREVVRAFFRWRLEQEAKR